MKRWWQHRTLRVRLAMWYAVGGTILFAGFSATLYFYVAERMARPLDHQLRGDLAEVERRLEVRADGRVYWRGREVGKRKQWMTQYPWFELWDENGNLVRRFWPFSENRVAETHSAPARGRETISVFNVAPDLRLRVLSLPYAVTGQETTWTLRLLRIHEPVADALGALRLIIIVVLPVVVALLVVGGYSITQRSLQPLNLMANEANRISADDLSRRLHLENPHDEVGSVAAVFNITLDRLEASFDALDRFVADASHELRTPLTTLRSVGEVGLRRGRTVVEYREIIGSMLEEAQRLQLLIGRLLELATAEGGAPDVHRTELKVDEYVTNCVQELGILAEVKGQHFSLETVPCQVLTDPIIFRQALQNLIDNAVKFSPEGSTIRVTVQPTKSQVEVAVIDQGPGISPENQVHLTKRFFRPDRGRGRSTGGFGLGLSITRAYMHVLGGSLVFESKQPNGSCFTLRLPMRPAGTSS